MAGDLPGPVAKTPAGDFFTAVADPAIFCGGGSVAALAGAGAGATALLVMRLNARRRSNAARLPEIEAAVAETERFIAACYAAADEDIRLLQELLDAQRALKVGGTSEAYLRALAQAAESPIVIAEHAASLLPIIATQVEVATRFTVSDLGAAAVLLEGACRAALLTAEVNIALLAEQPDVATELVDALDRRRVAAEQAARTDASAIEARTHHLLRREREQP
jgi:formiminotetrahydrofolate cyclodeaminase